MNLTLTSKSKIFECRTNDFFFIVNYLQPITNLTPITLTQNVCTPSSTRSPMSEALILSVNQKALILSVNQKAFSENKREAQMHQVKRE